jgi:hypothetical protein
MPVSAFLVILLSATNGESIPAPRSAEPLHPRIDVLVAAGFGDLAKFVAPKSDDAEFVRRVTLDLAGTIPTAAETRAFLEDRSPDKRVKLIDHLLDGPGYVRRMVWFWDVTLMERRSDSKVPRAAWEAYLRAAVAENRPYDAFVREMLTEDGADPKTRPAAKFFLDRELEPNLVTKDLGRIFLGRNLQCAQCHDHPQIDDYLQEHYYGIQAFLSRSFLFPNPKAATAVIAEKAEGDVTFMSVFDKNKKSNTTLPRMPGAKPVAEPTPAKGKEYKVAPAKDVRPVPAYSRRAQLPAALTSPDNPAFARNAVNRIWAMMMGRGLVHPVDMDHGGNPPSHPELLDLLAAEFVAHRYDVRWLVRQIALSEAYHRSSVAPPGLEEIPEDRYRVANLKPLMPEQLAYALLQASGQTDSERAALAKLGPKAIEEQVDARLATRVPPFRSMFSGRAGESQDGFAATLDQTLFLKYNTTVRGMIAPRAGNLADRLAKIDDAGAFADELFMSVLSRPPTNDEKKDVADTLASAGDRAAATAELVWALVASAEFRFNH